MSVKSETSETTVDVRGFDSYTMTLGDLMRGERATMGKSLLDVQRDLKIKAIYVAAIENCDPSVFPTRGFIAGHVRSYARYLGLDPEQAFAQFCNESDYSGVHPDSSTRLVPSSVVKKPAVTAKPRLVDPLSNLRAPFIPSSNGVLSQISASGLGSILVLLVLIAGIGYGAWAVLQDIQRVEFAPIDQSPGVVEDLAFLDAPEISGVSDRSPAFAETSPSGLDRLYRPQELDVPVLIARDGPISSLDPGSIGALVPNTGERLVSMSVTDPVENDPVVVEDTVVQVAIVANNPAWVRVSQADGTILFEKILDAGESYILPDNDVPLVLRAGNSSSVFVSVADQIFGPVGQGGAVVRDVSLAAADIETRFETVANFEELGLPQPAMFSQNSAGN